METLLSISLIFVALLGFAYRVYRLTKGGPMTDVLGQGALAVVLILLAFSAGSAWSRWVALAFSVGFAAIVMPVWVLGVLIPMRPRFVDYAFTAMYWAGLIVIGISALLL